MGRGLCLCAVPDRLRQGGMQDARFFLGFMVETREIPSVVVGDHGTKGTSRKPFLERFGWISRDGLFRS
jgi:hypothetical protein